MQRREIILASALQSASGTSSPISLRQDAYTAFICLLDVTAINTGTTLDVYIQQELPDGTWDDFAHFTQVTTVTGKWVVKAVASGNVAAINKDAALAAGTVSNGPIGGNWRIKWVIVGTSYTFAVKVDLYG